MEASLVRGEMLFTRGRYADAEVELRKSLAVEPENPVTTGLLALAVAQQDRFDEALAMARSAIGQGPDEPYAHFVLALVHLGREEILKAKAAIIESLRLDRDDPDSWSVLASIHIVRSEYKEALDAAEHGLEIDPEDSECQSLRVQALTQLGRRDEAAAAIHGQLQRNPDDPMTHANKGWALLHTNQPKEAAVHFREALRLDPESDYARSGMLNALRARNPIFRVLLAYFMWMSRLSGGARWGVVIGGYVAFRAMRSLSEQYPALRPWLIAPMVLYILFCFLSWTGPTLSNLLLRFNKFGRYLLSADQVRASNAVGGSLLVSLTFLVAALLTQNMAFFLAAGMFFVMIIPLASTFGAESNRGRTTLAVLTGVLFFLGMSAVALAFIDTDLAGLPGLLFMLGFFAFTWIANVVSSRKPS